MDVQVVIVSCKGSIFSENAERTVLHCLDSINRGDVGNVSLRVQSFDLLEVCHNTVAVTIRKAKVQILIVTHAFLDVLRNSGRRNYCQLHLNRILHSTDVICILTGLTSEDVYRSHANLFPHIMDWNVLELRTNRPKIDAMFSTTFREFVIQSYNRRARHYESRIPHPRLDSAFSAGNTTVEAAPDEPQRRRRHASCVKPLLLCTRSDEGTETITIKLNEAVGPSDVLKIELRKGDDVYSTTVQIPENLSPSASQNSILKIDAPFIVGTREANSDDPIDQMILKFPGYKQYLDDHISRAIEQAYSQGSTVESLLLLQQFLDGREDLLPTVLHFAAYYGLKETAVSMLATEDGLNSVEATNQYGETPLEMAERRGHDATVGQIFKEYESIGYIWEAIKPVTSCRRTGVATSVQPNAEAASNSDAPEVPSRTETSNDTIPEEEPDSADGEEAKLEYINIQLVLPPVLPERKDSPQQSQYCVPPNPRPVLFYEVPPPPREVQAPVLVQKGDGTASLLLADNYIDLKPEGYVPGSTLKRLNRNPIQTLLIRDSTSDEEDVCYPRPVPRVPVSDQQLAPEEYNQPVPRLPTPERTRVPRLPSPVPNEEVLPGPTSPSTSTNDVKAMGVELDALDKELLKIMEHALLTENKTREQIEQELLMLNRSPEFLVLNEENQKALEDLREKYFEIQGKMKRNTNKEPGFMNRVINGLRRARKKISNAGLRNSEDSSSSSSSSELTTPTLPSPCGFNYPTSNSTFYTPRRKSSSLTNVLEESEVGSPDLSFLRKRRTEADLGAGQRQSQGQSRNSNASQRESQYSGDYLFLRQQLEKEESTGGMTVENGIQQGKSAEPPSQGGSELEPPPLVPPRLPPKKPQSTKGDLPPLPKPDTPIATLDEMTDEERRLQIPPKPARRKIENPCYINCDRTEDNQKSTSKK